MKRGQRLSLRVKAVEDEEKKGSWKVKRWEKERRLHPDVKKETAVWEILFFSVLAHVPLFQQHICYLLLGPFTSVELEYTQVISQSSRPSF